MKRTLDYHLLPHRVESCARLEAAGRPLRVAGYSTRYEEPGRYGDATIYIARGALDRVNLKDPTIKALIGHNTDWVLGSVGGKSLSLALDKHGLFMTLDLPDTAIGHHIYELVRRGDLNQQSVGIYWPRDGEEWHRDDDGNKVLIIKRAEWINEVSLVAFPAIPTTSVGVVDGGPARIPPGERIPVKQSRDPATDGLARYRRAAEERDREEMERRRAFVRAVEAEQFEEKKAALYKSLYS